MKARGKICHHLFPSCCSQAHNAKDMWVAATDEMLPADMDTLRRLQDNEFGLVSRLPARAMQDTGEKLLHGSPMLYLADIEGIQAGRSHMCMYQGQWLALRSKLVVVGFQSGHSDKYARLCHG